MGLRHKFASGIPDWLDPALVKPSNWNDDHVVDFEGLAKSVGGTLLMAVAGTDYLLPNGSGAQLTGLTATQVGLGNVTNESKTTMFTSPAFTGTPTGPTATVGTNTAQLSTTAFVIGQAATATPLASAVSAAVGTATTFARADHVHPSNFTATATDIKMNGTQAVGALTTFCRADHVHPTDTSRAPVASPTFTGIATAPQFTSTIATGTAPLTVTSTTMVSNLNAQYIGGTALSGLSPLAGPGSSQAFTVGTLTTGSGLIIGLATTAIQLGASWGNATLNFNAGATTGGAFNTVTGFTTMVGGYNLTTGANGYIGTTDNYGLDFKTNNIVRMQLSTTGAVTATSFNSITGLATTTPLSNTGAYVGVSTKAAREDHRHDASILANGDYGDISVSGSTWTVESVAGNLAFTGVGARIRGDFSNTTIANRTMFQTSTSGGNTSLGLLPHPSNPTPITTFEACLSSDPANTNVMQAQVTQTDVRFNSGARGSASPLPMTFYTGGSERMRIDTSGNVTMSSAAGLGYGTGAGGTVTQATSKYTAVTLNKPTGQITMNNAALAAGASVIFIFYNSLLTIFDTLIVNQPWGVVVDNNNYRVEVIGCGTGAARIRVTNIGGVSLSEAVEINFAIIKGAIS